MDYSDYLRSAVEREHARDAAVHPPQALALMKAAFMQSVMLPECDACVNVTQQLVASLKRAKRVHVVCCAPGLNDALGGSVGGVDVRSMRPGDTPPGNAGDVIVVVTPVSRFYIDIRREPCALRLSESQRMQLEHIK